MRQPGSRPRSSGNLGIGNLQVSYDNGTCRLSGECPSAEAMQKAVLFAGNVQGVSAVDVAGSKVPPLKPEEEKVEYYIIHKGDTLSKITKHYYGDANKYPRIFEANREVIKDANNLPKAENPDSNGMTPHQCCSALVRRVRRHAGVKS